MALSIASSEATVEPPQIDGRRFVAERHTDSGGSVHEFRYLSDVGTDAEAVMAERAAVLPDRILRAAEDKEMSHGVF
jgi:hypothetical protein